MNSLDYDEMYFKHDLFESPENEETRIWRYINFKKFVDLLEKRALFFSRADKLSDQFEGSIPKPTIRTRKNISDSISFDRSSQYTKAFKKVVLVNCWHMNDFESDAMWKLYLKEANGVAIQSTFKNLVQCFDADTKNIVYIGKVNYIDYNIDSFQEGNIFQPYIFKRKEFQHERELRVITLYTDANVNKPDFLSKVFDFNGINIPVDLHILIERVYICPNARKGFFNLVKSIMREYALDIEPTKSSLEDEPQY